MRPRLHSHTCLMVAHFHGILPRRLRVQRRVMLRSSSRPSRPRFTRVTRLNGLVIHARRLQLMALRMSEYASRTLANKPRSPIVLYLLIPHLTTYITWMHSSYIRVPASGATRLYTPKSPTLAQVRSVAVVDNAGFASLSRTPVRYASVRVRGGRAYIPIHRGRHCRR